MKTSNVLIITFIASITVYLLVAFTEIRVSGTRNSLGRQYENHPLTSGKFNTVEATYVELHVRFGEVSSLAISVERGQPVPAANFHLRGDTLVITGHDQSASPDRYLLTLPEHGRADIHCQHSRLFLEDGRTEELRLRLIETKVIRHRADTAQVKHLQVRARDHSSLDLNRLAVDTLDVDLDQSQADILSSVAFLRGQMRNQSRLILDDAARIEFKRDTHSFLHMRR